MKRAGRLMERVIERDNLRLAFWKAARGKRTKRDAALFAARLDGNLEDLARELDEETYAAGPYHQFTIYQPLPGGDGFPGLPDLPEPHHSQPS